MIVRFSFEVLSCLVEEAGKSLSSNNRFCQNEGVRAGSKGDCDQYEIVGEILIGCIIGVEDAVNFSHGRLCN